MKPISKKIPLPSDTLRDLVNSKHFIVFPVRADAPAQPFEYLTLEQYSQKIALYLSSLRNLN